MSDRYSARAELDRPDGIYKIGETAVCTVDFFKNELIFPCRIHCKANIEHETVIDETVDYQGETLSFRIRGTRPAGSVSAFRFWTRQPEIR